MVIKSYHIILAVKILGCFLLKWAGFAELWAGNRQPDLATLDITKAGKCSNFA